MAARGGRRNSRKNPGELSFPAAPVRLGASDRTEEDLVKYVCLIYQGSTPLPGSPEWEALDPEEQKKIYADYGALNQIEGVTGGPPLGLPQDATTVRVQDGRPLVTDGPFAATKEVLGGFFVLEAENLDAAMEVAARVPAARLGGAVEIRPVATYW